MKIAVVGSGISGLGSALLLSQKYEVHLFEASNRLGGHAHTTNHKLENQSVNVDTGFLVYNDLTYPQLKSMFKFLGVETVASDMSLSIQVPQVGLEWAGDNLDTVFAQRRNLISPKFFRLLLDILKFHKNAEAYRELSRIKRWTVGDLLRNQKYSKELQEWYILPMVAAIWSTPEKGMLDFPAETFLTFFLNHKLLQVKDRPVWRTVKNGSVNYVNKIAERLQYIHLDEAVQSVESINGQLHLASNKGKYVFDKVIFANHAPVTAKIYKFKNSAQEKILQSFSTVSNRAYLHEDLKFMPQKKKCWASWNVQAQLKSQFADKVSLTYYLNRLQPLNTDKKLLLTLNPNTSPEKTIFETQYDHPQFNQKAIDAQVDIPDIQGYDGVYFAGAWTRYGFHEDGLLSAVKVAEKFGLSTPWRIT